MNAISLQVKAYLLPESARVTAQSIKSATEIRRFVLVHPWAGSYDELVRKVTQSFGDFIKAEEATSLCFYWQDEEGELVGFSSDNEMKYANDLLVALQSSNGGSLVPHVFKVYIGRKYKAPTPPPVVNYGVNCDGCQASDFVGARFKCQTCPDYDLCSTCESKGVHKDSGHVFTKIEGSRCPRNRNPFGFGPGVFGGPRGGCHGRRHGAHGGFAPPPTMPLFGGMPAGTPSAGAAGIPDMANVFNNLGQYLPVYTEEQLKTFGQSLKGMLEPFGVDVDYWVDNVTKAAGDAKKQETKTEAGPAPAANPTPSPAQQDASFSAASPAAPETASNTDVLMDETASTFRMPEQTSIPTPSEQPNPFLQVINMMKDFSTKNAVPATANINAPTTSAAAAASASSAPSEDSFVTLDTEMEKEIKIIRAIEQLKAMGYMDDSGWLMRLVIAKDGNINAVLDAIQPK